MVSPELNKPQQFGAQSENEESSVGSIYHAEAVLSGIDVPKRPRLSVH
jgi:hypothetical protein